MANLTTRLRELRREQDMTQEVLATAIGIGKSTYQNYEQGDQRPRRFTGYWNYRNT